MVAPGYSSNLHSAETVAEIEAAIGGFSAAVRAELGWPRLGLDLRLGSVAIGELADPRRLGGLRRALERAGCDAYSINAFPLAPFQAPVVKRAAYLPDWTQPERLADTRALIAIALALSDEPELTISTVPGAYRPIRGDAASAAAIARALGAWAGAAAEAARASGRCVVLCLEPEPWCLLETSWDVAAFWRGPLSEHGLTACARALGGDETAARAALARHLGICLDTCHVSLAFEDQAEAVSRMAAAGARVAKCQFSAAPEVLDPHADPEGLAALARLAEPRFLHQTAAASASGSLSRVEDLDELEACLGRLPGASAVRSHFHIPVFREPSARGLSTTVQDSVAGLAAARAAGCTHVSVETYTWSILAAHERDARAGTVRELRVLERLLAGPTSHGSSKIPSSR